MSSARCFFLCCPLYTACFPVFYLLCVFSIMSENLPNQVQKAIGAIEACQMDDLLYQERSIDQLDFSPVKGTFCIQYCLYLFVRLYFSLIASVMKSL